MHPKRSPPQKIFEAKLFPQSILPTTNTLKFDRMTEHNMTTRPNVIMEAIKEKHDLGRLEKQFGTLQSAIKEFADDRFVAELIRIIKQPGWTTPAEYFLVSGITEQLITQVKAAQALKNVLVKGSRQVGI